MSDAPTPIPLPADFPVAWPRPEDATLSWERELTHCPEAMPALGGDFWHLVWAGMQRAGRQVGSAEQMRLLWINNYIYVAQHLVVAPDEREAAEEKARAARVAQAGNLQAFWADEVLPQIRDYLDRWDRFDLQGATPEQFSRHIDDTWDWLGHIWTLHFNLPAHHALGLFFDYYQELFGGEAQPLHLLLGVPNKTTDMGRALWALGQRLPAGVAGLLPSTPGVDLRAALAPTAAGQDFLSALDEFLAAYGHRGNHWGLQYPTWIEEPAPVFAALHSYLSGDAADPATAFAAQQAAREGALAAARDHLRGYPQKARDRFEELLVLAQCAATIREDHNFWIDFSCTSRVRRAMLAAGRRLAAAGALDSAADVMHLHVEEIRAALAEPGDWRELVAARRAALQKFAAIAPPHRIGVEPETTAAERDESASDEQEERDGPTPDAKEGQGASPPDAANLLRGQPSAPGTARGPARIAVSPTADAALASGEILVARSTAPSYTPLFATASGVVTEIGGALSHSGIAAREYGIPAVVLSEACAQIADGQWLEVDGDAGTVRLIEPPGA